MIKQNNIIIVLIILSHAPVTNGQAMEKPIVEKKQLWPDGIVYYQLLTKKEDINLSTHPQKQQLFKPVDLASARRIQESMKEIQDKTNNNILFFSSSNHPNRVAVHLVKENGNLCGQAILGYGWERYLVITDTEDCNQKGTIIHELMHTIGFGHENERIEALKNPNQTEDVKKVKNRYIDTSLETDDRSVTHGFVSQERNTLSAGDIKAINLFYGEQSTTEGRLRQTRNSMPEHIYQPLTAIGSNLCLNVGYSIHPEEEPTSHILRMDTCDRNAARQYWAHNGQQQIVNLEFDETCLDKNRNGYAVLTACKADNPDKRWHWRGHKLYLQPDANLQLIYIPHSGNIVVQSDREYANAQWQWLASTPEPRNVLTHRADQSRNQRTPEDNLNRHRRSPANPPVTRLTAAAPPHVKPQAPTVPPPIRANPIATTTPPPTHVSPMGTPAQPPSAQPLSQWGRLLTKGLCMTAQPGTTQLYDKESHFVRMQACRPADAAQQWKLQNGKLINQRYPQHCLDNTGLHLPDPGYLAFAGLHHCRPNSWTQQWQLRKIDKSDQWLIEARASTREPFNMRLSSRDDNYLHYLPGYQPDPRSHWLIQ